MGLCLIIRAYQWGIRPILAPSCRFYPSCSVYAYDAMTIHGPFKGTWMTIRRLLKCHPWHPGGYDPVLHQTQENV